MYQLIYLNVFSLQKMSWMKPFIAFPINLSGAYSGYSMRCVSSTVFDSLFFQYEVVSRI
jgi:hypothetical protein